MSGKQKSKDYIILTIDLLDNPISVKTLHKLFLNLAQGSRFESSFVNALNIFQKLKSLLKKNV